MRRPAERVRVGGIAHRGNVRRPRRRPSAAGLSLIERLAESESALMPRLSDSHSAPMPRTTGSLNTGWRSPSSGRSKEWRAMEPEGCRTASPQE